MCDCRQMLGMLPVLSDMLKSMVRKVRALGPRCLRWRVLILSGPVAFEGFACLMASVVS